MSEGSDARLRALYDASLGPFLAAQDARILAARRRRWVVLFGGLGLAGAIFAWVVAADMSNELVPMAGFAIAVGSIAIFWFATAGVSDDIRRRMMADIAPLLGLRYEPGAEGFDLGRFALLGMAGYDKVSRGDRLSGRFDGLGVDMMAARLADVTTSGIGENRKTRTDERFSGLLLRATDPAPGAARFRLVPPAGATAKGALRDVSIVTHSTSGKMAVPSFAELDAMLAATAEAAPATPTGDAAFDARFELHAKPDEAAAALARLDAATRAALLDIAANFGGGAVSVGFDAGDILFAFVTKQRFEIGRLRPPMAQFERVQHLADQMAILAVIAGRLRDSRKAG